MFRSRSIVSFMSMIVVLGGGAVLVAACRPSGVCCCVTGANNIPNCYPVIGKEADACPGSLEQCMSFGLGGNGPGVQAVPSDGGAR